MEIEESVNRKKYIERINRSLDYIDTHISDEIRVEDLAQAASFSQFHFHRIFCAIIGETPDNYVRRIRLEYAASLMFKNRLISITDAAMRSGFSTPALFSRNFKKHFGLPPSLWLKSRIRQNKSNIRQIESRNRNAQTTTGAVHITGKGYREELSVKVIRINPFQVAFVRHLYGYNRGIRTAYLKLFRWLSIRGMVTPETRIIGIPMDNPYITSPEKCRYYAAASISDMVDPAGEVGVMDIAGGIYAVARFSGKYGMIKDFDERLYGEWLPDSGYEPVDAFTFMVYLKKPEQGGELLHEFDQYIPVKPM